VERNRQLTDLLQEKDQDYCNLEYKANNERREYESLIANLEHKLSDCEVDLKTLNESLDKTEQELQNIKKEQIVNDKTVIN